MNRRQLIQSAGAALGCGLAGGVGLALANSTAPIDLRMQLAHYRLREKMTNNLVSLSGDGPPPILRMRQDEPVHFRLHNGLDEYTAMHWHGIRLANNMDGVPYLTQYPIAGGETFDYIFTPPDAGTYWYHPHCMTMTQMARGLTGVLVVEEKSALGFDGDQVINLKDFKLDTEDQLLKPYSLRRAARSGTLGNVITANWQTAPIYDHPSGGIVRLRLANTDTTRIYRLNITGGSGRVIAWDGHPVDEAMPFPDTENLLELGPGQRADLAVLMPKSEGQTLSVETVLGNGKRNLAQLRSVGS